MWISLLIPRCWLHLWRDKTLVYILKASGSPEWPSSVCDCPAHMCWAQTWQLELSCSPCGFSVSNETIELCLIPAVLTETDYFICPLSIQRVIFVLDMIQIILMLLSGNVSIRSATAFTLGLGHRSSLFICLSRCVLLPTCVTSVMTSLKSLPVDQVHYWKSLLTGKNQNKVLSGNSYHCGENTSDSRVDFKWKSY